MTDRTPIEAESHAVNTAILKGNGKWNQVDDLKEKVNLMNTIRTTQLLRRLMGTAAATSLVLGSAVMLTACEPDPPPPSPPPEQTADRTGQQQPDTTFDERERDRTMEDRQVTQQDDPMARDQTDPVTGQPRTGQPPITQQDRDPAMTAGQDEIDSDRLIGSTVMSREGEEEIGTVEDVLYDEQGNPEALIVALDDREIAIQWDRVSVVQEGQQPGARGAGLDDPGMGQQPGELVVIAELSREELEEQPEFDRDQQQ